MISRIVSWAMALLIGAAFGTAGTFGVTSVPPIGLIVAMVGCAAILVGLRLVAEDRWTIVWGALGMYAAVLLFSMRGPGGSVVLPDTVASQVWMIGIGLIILVIAAWPDLSRLRAAGATRPAPARTDS